MRIYRLKKVVLNIKNNMVQFLKGLTSNTLDQPCNAFVNIHGRIIATFDQLRISDDEFVVLIEQPFIDVVLEHVDRYAKLSGVKIERLERNVYFDLDSDTPLESSDWMIAQKKGRVLITSRLLKNNIFDEDFTFFRVKNNLPIHGVDYKDDFLLNVSEDFVSFTKGCFLGQEPIAKVHNRSKPTWKLVVKAEDDCSSEEKQKMTSKVIDPEKIGRASCRERVCQYV